MPMSNINIRTDSNVKLQDGEDTLAQSLADMDSGVRGLSLDEFDRFMQNVIRKGAAYSCFAAT